MQWKSRNETNLISGDSVSGYPFREATLISQTLKDEPANYDGSEDQTTTYVHDMNGNVRTYLRSTTTPDGITTSIDHNWGIPHGVRITKMLGGSSVTLSDTHYVHNSVNAITEVYTTWPGVNSHEYSWYYKDSSNRDTVWLLKHVDVRGTWTYYERDPDNLAFVTAIKVAPSNLTTCEPD